MSAGSTRQSAHTYFEHFRRIGPFIQSTERGNDQSALHLDTAFLLSRCSLMGVQVPAVHGWEACDLSR